MNAATLKAVTKREIVANPTSTSSNNNRTSNNTQGNTKRTHATDAHATAHATEYSEWLEYLGQITSLEKVFSNGVARLRSQAVELSDAMYQKEVICENSNANTACVTSAWRWLTTLHKCTEKHLEAASQYHQVLL